MYHKIIVVGNVTRDPELRYTPAGKAVCTLNIAVNDGWGDNKSTIWIKAAVWEKGAESAAEHVKKGSSVLVEGRLSPDKDTGSPRVYQRKDGEYGASYDMTAEVWRFVGNKNTGAEVVSEVSTDENIPF